MQPFLYLDESLSKAQDPSKQNQPQQPTGGSQPSTAAAPSPSTQQTPGQPQQSKQAAAAPATSGGQKSNIDWNSHYPWDSSKGPPPQNAVQYKKRDGTVGYAVPQGSGGGAAAPEPEPSKVEPSEEETRSHGHYSSMVSDTDSASPGVFSVNPEDYPEDSNPYAHYQIAQHHGKTGYAEGEVGHKRIARERMKNASPEEHQEIAHKLKEMGYHEDAAWHQDRVQQMSYKPPTPGEVDENRDIQDDQAYTPPTPGEMDAKRQPTEDQSYTPPTPGEMDFKREKSPYSVGEEDPKSAGPSDVQTQHAQSYKPPTPAEMDQDRGMPSTSEEAESANKEMKREYEESVQEHQKKLQEHEKKKPEELDVFTEVAPLPTGSDVKDAKAKKEFAQKQREHKKAQLKHKADTQKWKKRLEQLKKQAPEKPEYHDVKELKAQEKEAESKAKEAQKQKAEESQKQKAEEAAKPRTPQTDVEHAQVAGHKADAQKLLDNVQAHLDSGKLSESDREKLERVQSAAQKHAQQSTVPTDEAKELKELQKLAGEHGKKPPEEEGDPGMEENPQERSKKLNLKRIAASASAAGQAAGRAALHGETAGALGGMALNYAGQGVVSAGHSLLDKYQDSKIAKQEAEGRAQAQAAQEAAENSDATDKAPKPKKEGAEQEQASMGKSLPLYLDLHKAVSQTPNVGVTPKKDKRARIEHDSSYATQHSGVASEGIVTPDDPDVGKKWKHDDEDSVQADVDAELDDEYDENKDKASKALMLAKSLNDSLHAEAKRYRATSLEEEFMIDVLGLPADRVMKGLSHITGRNRHLFNEWAHSRLSKSLGSLMRFSYER